MNERAVKQHVVSRVVLAEFTVDRLLEVEDCRSPGRWRRRSPAAVGYVNDFVKHDTGQVEALWQTVETRLKAAKPWTWTATSARWRQTGSGSRTSRIRPTRSLCAVRCV